MWWWALLSCRAVDLGTSIPLMDPHAWQPWEGPDPVPAHRPEDPLCAPEGWGPEGASLEIDTALCPYATLVSPLLAPLAPGDPVEAFLWHTALSSDAPARGHLALMVGGEALVQIDVDIPSEPRAHTLTAIASVAAEAGEPLILHLHNHGANNWNLLYLEAQPR